MRAENIVTALRWISTYKKGYLKGDLAGGLTVGVMLIPQGMAYAMVAGLPPIYGLYAAFIPQIFYALFGTSRHLSVAPGAMISLLIGAGLSAYAAPNSEAFIKLAISLALLTGLFQLIFGLFRMGFLVNFLSNPVISGYTSAAGIIIGLSQLKHILGIDIPSDNLLHVIIRNIFQHLGEVNMVSLIIGLSGIAVILFLKKINRMFPGPIIVVALGILTAWYIDPEQTGLNVLGSVPEGLPGINFQVSDWKMLWELTPLAFIISMVGFIESYSVAKTIQMRKRNYEITANKELIALGISNLSAGVFGTFPVSGGIARSVVNEQAGSNTNLSGIISAVLVGLTLMFLTPLFYYLPNAILAAVIIAAVIKLVDYKSAIFLFKTSRKDFLMMFATFILTLFFGVKVGIGAGVILSLLLVIYRSAYPHIALLGRLSGTGFYRNMYRFPEAEDRKDALIFRFDAPLYFANIRFFLDSIRQNADKKGTDLRVIILNAQSITAIDSTAARGLEELINDCQIRGVDFYMTEVIGPVRDMILKTGLKKEIGEDHFHLTIQEALDHFDGKLKDKSGYAMQTNGK